MSSPGTYAYKVICHLSGLEEKWPTTNQKERVEFEGGYVSKPINEIIKGKIYCFDFNSAYPHAYMMINLFGYNCTCCKEKEKYNGKKLFSNSDFVVNFLIEEIYYEDGHVVDENLETIDVVWDDTLQDLLSREVDYEQ